MGLFGRKPVDEPDDVIDLREEPASRVVWGMPAPCPDCGLPGYLDHIDPYERVMFQHCPACSARWSIAEADIIAANRMSSWA
jgi:hypothetical protein